MSKVFAAYDSKYGNTRIAAEKILEGINQVGEFETTISDVKEIDIEKLAEYDALILGAPNHMGRPSQTMKKFVNKLSALNLKITDVAVFGTYSGAARTPDRAVKKLEQMVRKRLPTLNLLSPSLSVRVKGIPGPIWEGELPKCIEFGKNIASQIKRR